MWTKLMGFISIKSIFFSVFYTYLVIMHLCTVHHHVVPLARISLTLSRHFSPSFITSGWSSGLHPVSSHICWMYIRAGRPAFSRPYVGVHRSTSLMSSSLLLQQCPAGLVRLTWIVFVMGGRWPYSWCLVGCVQLITWKACLFISWKYKKLISMCTNICHLQYHSVCVCIYIYICVYIYIYTHTHTLYGWVLLFAILLIYRRLANH